MDEMSYDVSSITDGFTNVLNNIMNVFLVNGLSIEIQQVLKFAFLLIGVIVLLTIINLTIKLITHILSPIVTNLGKNVEYLFYTIVAVLIFTFTKDVTFGTASFVLFCLLLATQAAPIYKAIQDLIERQNNKPPKEDDRGY